MKTYLLDSNLYEKLCKKKLERDVLNEGDKK
jgi:hypothetical protein